MSPLQILIVMFASMLVTMLTGRQIFFIVGAVGAISAVLLWGTGGIDMAFYATYSFMKWWMLVVIPLFVFMGQIMAKSGVADGLFDAMFLWSGRVRGGLGMGTVGVCSLLAAMSATSACATVTAGTIALPAMLKRKYDKRMVTGICQAGGALGFLIPPSVVLLLYGMIARVSVGHLWLAGVFPGLLLAGFYIAYIGIRCRIQPQMGPALPSEIKIGWGEKFRSLRYAIAPLGIIFCVIGLLTMGVTSVTESAAIGVVGALGAALLYKRLSWKIIREALDETTKVTAMFFWVIAAALLFSAVFNGLGAVDAIEGLVLGVGGGNRYLPIIVMMFTWIGLGMVMDETAMLIIVAALYIPIVANLGFSLVWFGILYCITSQMAYITPPFGYNIFIMKGIVPKDISLKDIYLSAIPFVGLQAAALGILIAFPQISLWLPNMIFG